jgi:hypothetical protein
VILSSFSEVSEPKKRLYDSARGTRQRERKTSWWPPCKLAGLGFTTFNDWREEDSFFAQKIEFVEAQAIERNLALIQQAALKDWKAAAWLLERRHPDMFARPEVQLNQHVSLQAPSNDLNSWLHKVIPSVEALVRGAPTNEEYTSDPRL